MWRIFFECNLSENVLGFIAMFDEQYGLWQIEATYQPDEDDYPLGTKWRIEADFAVFPARVIEHLAKKKYVPTVRYW